MGKTGNRRAKKDRPVQRDRGFVAGSDDGVEQGAVTRGRRTRRRSRWDGPSGGERGQGQAGLAERAQDSVDLRGFRDAGDELEPSPAAWSSTLENVEFEGAPHEI
jgi:hypothetical protein